MDFTPRIELLTLGDELLLGIRENAHLKYIGGQLERYGLTLTRNMVVMDDSDEIKTSFSMGLSLLKLVIGSYAAMPATETIKIKNNHNKHFFIISYYSYPTFQ